MNSIKTIVCSLTIGVALVAAATSAQAGGDAAAGKAFYEKTYAGNKYAQSAGVGAVGCVTCHHTGYHGRTVLYEILECTSAITSALSEGVNEDTLLKHALQANFTPMAQVGKRLVAQGLTSMEEVLRVTRED